MNLSLEPKQQESFSTTNEIPALCQACLATKAWVRAKRLMTQSDVDRYLDLSSDQVQVLIDTRQITAIRIRGEDRFDSRELDLLIDTYKKTAQRRG